MPLCRRIPIAGFLAAVLLSALVVVTPMQVARAADTTPFAIRFSTNANGALTTIGNNLLTCPDGVANCAAARAGAVYDNNQFTMVNLDADSDASTFNSSASSLNLPVGSTVLFAGLYWGARLQKGTNGIAGTGTRTQVKFRAPGDSAYRTISSGAEFGPNTSSYNAYQEFADVTSIVQAAGNGMYWSANVVAGTGEDRYAGWAMTVAYSAPGLPLRNITVFDGFSYVGRTSPQTVQVSGFRAPQSGTVDAQLTMVAYEGDAGSTGDYTTLNTTQLATALSPGSNFFNSVNDNRGTSSTTRLPADTNMLGFDIKNLGASGAISNGSTSATFTFSSAGDTYYPGVVGLAINLYAPDYTASSKTVVDLNGNDPARPGDTLQYTLNYANTGQDPALRVASQDPLPANTSYVPGSLARIDPLTGATTPLSDGSGDDAGEYDPAARTVRVRLGAGATAATGGRMACSGTGCTDDGSSRAAYTFQVTVDDAAGGTTVTNLATLNYRTATTDLGATYTTNPAAVQVTNRANLAITKTMTPDPAAAGGAITATMTITNHGPNTATGVTLRDPLMDGWINDGVDAPAGVTCVVGTELSCSVGTVANGASVTVRLRGHMAPDAAPGSLTNVAYVSTTAYDPDLTDNVASDTISLVRSADLAITKTASPATAAPGATVSYTLTVRNNGPSDAQDVQITDSVDDVRQLTLTAVTGTTGGARCADPQGAGLTCTAPALAAGASVTVTVQGVLDPGLPAGTVVGNSATVASATPDPAADNNRATATVITSAPQSDVRITKTAPDRAVAGTTISYTVTATNYGPSNASDVDITDPAPDGVTFTGATTTRGTCTVTETSVDCPVGGLPAGPPGQPGATATITITGTVAADAPAGGLTNTATVTSNGPTRTASADTTVERSFDLSVTKSANRSSLPDATPQDPAPVDYTITVSNHGPSVATGVTITDLVPTVLQFVSATPGSGTCTAPTATADPQHDQLTCRLADPIAPGGTATVRVSTRAVSDLAAANQDVVETVTVAAPGESSSDDDTASWTLSGQPQNDLQLTKTAVPQTVTAGTDGTYHLDIVNNADPDAPLTAPAPQIVDTLPAGVTLVPAGAGSSTPTYCSVTDTSASGEQTVTCRLSRPDQNIGPDQHVGLDLTVHYAADLANGSSVVNTARVVNDPDDPDPAPANNTAQATTTVVTDADVAVSNLAMTPTDSGATGPGSLWYLSFDVGNLGPSVARDAQFRVSVDLDAAVLASSLPLDCDLDLDGELVCNLGDLEPDASGSYVLLLKVFGNVTPGEYTAHADASSVTPDSHAANNAADVPFTITGPRTALAVDKSAVGTVDNPDGDGHDSFVAGSDFTYRIEVSLPDDLGVAAADAHDVVVRDLLPPGFSAGSASTTAGTCSVTATEVICDVGTLAAFPGDPAPVTITVHGTVAVDTAGEQIANTVTATSSTPDQTGDPTAVSATAAVDVVREADLQLFKVADAPTADLGAPVAFTLTTVNAGPSDVPDAAITDNLPDGLTLDADASPGCSVVAGTQVRCVVGAVAAGTSVSVRLVATTSPTDPPRTITNTATVETQATDPDPSNDSSSADVSLRRLADLAISSTVSTTTPAAGEQITYTAHTTNTGPSAAWNTTGDSTFPPGFVPVSWDVPGSTCSWNRTPPADATTVAWQDFRYVLHCAPSDPSAPFLPGLATTSVVVMQIPGDAPQGGYPARASIATETPEATLQNNTTTQTVTVQHVSDTRITKTLVDPVPMLAGRPATWRLTVTNAGPSVAGDVIVSDTVPDGMAFVSAVQQNGTACPAPRATDTDTVVRCSLGTLAVGGSVSELVTFRLGTGTTGHRMCNAALVGSESLDPAAADNQARACGTVAAAAADVSPTATPSSTPPSTPPATSPAAGPSASPGPSGQAGGQAGGTGRREPASVAATGVDVVRPTLWALLALLGGGVLTVIGVRRRPGGR